MLMSSSVPSIQSLWPSASCCRAFWIFAQARSRLLLTIAKRSGSVSAGALVSAVGLLVSVTGALVLRTCMCFLLAYLKSVVVVISPASRGTAVIAGLRLVVAQRTRSHPLVNFTGKPHGFVWRNG